MHMRINNAGQDALLLHIDYVVRRRWWNVFRDGGNPPFGDRDVRLIVRRRRENPAILHQQIQVDSPFLLGAATLRPRSDARRFL